MTNYTLTLKPFSFHMREMSNDEGFGTNVGSLQTRERTGNRWYATIVFRRGRADYSALRGEILRLNGRQHRLVVPMNLTDYVRRGVGGGTPLVNGAHSAGAKTLSVKGMPNSTTGVLQPGDFIQVGNQLTSVTSILTSNGSGVGSCGIWPELHKNYADGATIVYTTACAGVYIKMNEIEIGNDRPIRTDWFSEMTVELMQDVLA